MADQHRRRLSDRLFAVLLYFFPQEFRGDFGEQMVEDFRDQQHDARRSGARLAAIRVWTTTALGVFRQAPREHLEILSRDVQYAIRLLRRSPAFTTVAALTLAFGIGTNTAIFTLADGMLFRPLPFRDSDHLVLIQGFDPRKGEAYSRVERVDFEQMRAHHSGIAGIATIESGRALSWIGSDGAESISTSLGTPNLLEVLGVTAHIGRILRPGDEAIEPRAAMLTYDAWRRRFRSERAVVGRTLVFDQRPVQVVGVLPQRFIYPVQGSLVSGELLMVAAPAAAEAANPRAGVWTPVARLNPGVSIQQAQTELDVLVRRSAQQFPETAQDRALRIADLQFALFELSRPLLWLLVGAAGCVVLIACANLATLLVARGAVREREIGIRMAIGASRGRVVKQLIVEALVIGGLGGLAALLIAWFTFGALAAYVPATYRLIPETLDVRAMVFTAMLSIVASMLFGVLPALHVSRRDVNASIRERRHLRVVAGGLMKAGAPLVALEVALALILFAGTGLTVNSLIRMRTIDLGFEPAGVVGFGVGLPRNQYATPSAQYEYFDQLLRSVRQLPNVQVAGGIDNVQLGGAAPPRALRQSGPAGIGLWRVTPRYFEAIGTPMLAGRDFTDADIRLNAPVAIVNQTVARTLWPDQSPIGKSLDADGEPQLTVIGLVKDVRSGYGRSVNPSVYLPITRERFRWMSIVARGSDDPSALAVAMRTAAQRIDPALLVPRPQPLDAGLNSGIAKTRFETMLFSMFGLLGVLVAAIGVYGLMAFWVGARTQEMGVRLALGADSARIRLLVLKQAAVPLFAGVTCGLFGAFALAGRLESLLYGITPHDPATLAGVVAVLVAIGFAAAYLPARRAARVDPMVTLRAE